MSDIILHHTYCLCYVRVVLRILDALPTSSQGVTSGQLLQPASEFGDIKDLLKLLGLLLNIFEVFNFDVLDVPTRLTSAISRVSPSTEQMPTNNCSMPSRYSGSKPLKQCSYSFQDLSSRPLNDPTNVCSLVRVLIVSASRTALSLSQAKIINDSGNNNMILGDGTVTNNNWAINIIQIAEDQVRNLIAHTIVVLIRCRIVRSGENHCR